MKNENLPRINRKHVQEELQSNWFKKGLYQTFFGLFVSPGHRIRDYIDVSRDRLIKPITYLATTIVIYLWFDAQYAKPVAEIVNMSKSFNQNLLNLQLLSIVFKAWLMSHFFFKSERYNFYEYVVLLIYITAQLTIFGVIFLIGDYYLTSAFKADESLVAMLVFILVMLIQLVYFVMTIVQFFDNRTVTIYLKSISIYAIGLIFQCVLFFSYFMGYFLIFECTDCLAGE